MPLPERLLLHLGRHRRRAVDPAEVRFLEAVGEKTLVRLRPPARLVDTRPIGTLLPLLAPFGLVRVHRNHAVNVAHVLEVRRRDADADWEVALEPPVNAVLPVGRTYLRLLWAAFGEGRGRRPATGRRGSRTARGTRPRGRPRGR